MAPDTWGILKALTDMAKQNTAASAAHAAPASTNPLATLELSATANPYAAAAMSSPFASVGGLGQNAGILQPPERESGAESSGFRPETTGSHAPVGARCPSVDGNALSQQLQQRQFMSQQGLPQGQCSAACDS